MNLIRGSSNYATDQSLYPATQSGYRGPDYYSTSDVLGDVRKIMDQLWIDKYRCWILFKLHSTE